MLFLTGALSFFSEGCIRVTTSFFLHFLRLETVSLGDSFYSFSVSDTEEPHRCGLFVVNQTVFGR